jgi:hypothetical protein
MKRESLVLTLLVALAVTLLGVDQAQAATKISSFGFDIAAPGVYTVTQDLSGAGTGIRILTSTAFTNLCGGRIPIDSQDTLRCAITG